MGALLDVSGSTMRRRAGVGSARPPPRVGTMVSSAAPPRWRARAGRGPARRARSSSATVAKSRAAAALAARRADDARLASACGTPHPERRGEAGDEPQVLRRELERERDRRPVRVEEGRPLVADVRRADGARGEDVVGEPPGRCRPARRARAPRDSASLSPKIDGVHGELHRGAGPERTEVEDRLRQRLERRARPLEVGRVAADHDRQLPGLRRRGRAAHRRVEEARRRPRARRPRTAAACRG